MNGYLNTGQLIEMARQESQCFDTSTVFDGYASEIALYPKGNHILPLLNRALRNFVNTGFNKCYFRYAIVSGTREYLAHRGMGRIATAYLEDSNGKQQFIEQTTIGALDKLYYQTWRNRRAERPLGYYLIGTRAIGFDAEPTKAWTFVCLADSTVSDLVLATDIPARVLTGAGAEVLAFDGVAESALPEEVHDGLALYAASVLCFRKGDVGEGQRLSGEYKERLEHLKTLVASRRSPNVRRLSVRRHNNGSLYGSL